MEALLMKKLSSYCVVKPLVHAINPILDLIRDSTTLHAKLMYFSLEMVTTEILPLLA